MSRGARFARSGTSALVIDTEVRVGIVGAGGVARRHAGALASMPDVALVGVTDPDGGRAADLAAAVGTTAADDLDALLARGVDAVYVCVPPFAHGELERALAAAGGRPVRREAPGARRRGRRAGARRGRRGRGRRPRSGTTGAVWTSWPGPRAARRPHRPAGQRGSGWTRCRRCRGGRSAGRPAARSSSRPPTCSTSPGCWPARSPRCTPSADGRPAGPAATGRRLGHRRHAALRRRRRRHARRDLPRWRWKHRAGLELVRRRPRAEPQRGRS